MRSLWAVVVVGLGLAGNAGASRYEIPLPELKGVYSTGDWGPDRRTVSFDAGYGFERVDSIRIHVTGTIAPGLFRNPVPPDAQATPWIEFGIRSLGQTDTGPGILEAVGAFDTDAALLYPLHYNVELGMYEPMLHFLAQGRGEVDLRLGIISMADWVQVVPAAVGIEDAYLVIDGVASPVPEPAAGLVVVPAVLLLARRRRRG